MLSNTNKFSNKTSKVLYINFVNYKPYHCLTQYNSNL